MDVIDRLEGLIAMVDNIRRTDPWTFSQGPMNGFLDALVGDLKAIIEEQRLHAAFVEEQQFQEEQRFHEEERLYEEQRLQEEQRFRDAFTDQ